MDHLDYPLNTDIDHLRIPFLCDNEAEYDCGPYSTYPVRKGWTDEIKISQWLQCSDEDLARRVQLWLYFGLLSEFCGFLVPRAIFRHFDASTGALRISTARLPQLIDSRRQTLWSGRSKDIRELLEEALRFSDLVEAHVISRQSLLSLVSCSVRVLIQTLNSAQGLNIGMMSSVQRYQAGRRWPLRFSVGILEGWKISIPKAIEYRMIDLGWCPFQFADLKRKLSCNVVYYVSGLPTTGAVSHACCNDSRCIAYNVDESQYTPRHDVHCSPANCANIGITTATVAAIIRDNGIPLLSCCQSLEGKLRIDLIRAEPGTRYIAISHVWSGGLGNPVQNELPECEVRQLNHRIRKLRSKLSKRFRIDEYISPGKPMLFWMDTFCIPVGESVRIARKMAINSMAEIYSGADAVLVLDPDLQKLIYHNMEPEQSLTRVLCSSWMSRCWTSWKLALRTPGMFNLRKAQST